MLKSKHSASKSERKSGAWISSSIKPESFLPGLAIGFLLGLLVKLPNISRRITNAGAKNARVNSTRPVRLDGNGDEVKMVFVVRQDLKMGVGKVASQCAHAATAIYGELMRSQRALLSRWEQCGQPKIVVTCKNQQEMNKLQAVAEKIGLPTFIVADAGRTQVSAGSRTVLAIGPGTKAIVDSVTGKLRLL